MKIEIWGTYPPPIGGVSIHIKRLIHSINTLNSVCLKNFSKYPYKGTSDYIINIHCALFEFISLLWCKKKVIHIHSNSYITFFAFLIFGQRHKLGITLHNQRLGQSIPKIQQTIVSSFFEKVQFIILNDENYSKKIIKKYCIDTNKMYIIPAFIPPLNIERKGLPDSITDFKNSHKFLISSNASQLKKEKDIDIYGFDLLIDLTDKLVQKNVNVGIIFCLPVIGDPIYYKECIEKIKNLALNDHILIVNENMDNGFEVWEASDLFIRPTSTDMEGISIKEALFVGTPVIASNVCKRANETILFESRDIDDLFEKVYSFYKEESKRKIIKKPLDILSTTVSINNIYNNIISSS